MPNVASPVPHKFLPPADVYELLFRFNDHCEAAVALVESGSKQEILDKAEAAYYMAMLAEVRAAISQSLVEFLNGQEVSKTASAERRRLEYEQKLHG